MTFEEIVERVRTNARKSAEQEINDKACEINVAFTSNTYPFGCDSPIAKEIVDSYVQGRIVAAERMFYAKLENLASLSS